MNSMNPMQAMADAARNTFADPSPEPPIARELTALQNQITDLDMSISRLVERIEPVLGPRYEGPLDPSDKKLSEEKSVVARFIETERTRLESLTYTLNTITERIEA